VLAEEMRKLRSTWVTRAMRAESQLRFSTDLSRAGPRSERGRRRPHFCCGARRRCRLAWPDRLAIEAAGRASVHLIPVEWGCLDRRLAIVPPVRCLHWRARSAWPRRTD